MGGARAGLADSNMSSEITFNLPYDGDRGERDKVQSSTRPDKNETASLRSRPPPMEQSSAANGLDTLDTKNRSSFVAPVATMWSSEPVLPPSGVPIADTFTRILVRLMPPDRHSSPLLEVLADFTGLSDPGLALLHRLDPGTPALEFQHCYRGETLEKYVNALHPHDLGTGFVFPATKKLCPDPPAQSVVKNKISDQMTLLREHLEALEIGIVSFQESFGLIIYPIAQDKWTFMSGKEPPSEACLRCRMIGSLKPPADLELYQLRLTEFPRQIPELNCEKLFQLRHGEAERNIFIFLRPDRQEDFNIIIRALVKANAKVYHSGKAGSWSYFFAEFVKTKASGVILFEPEFISYKLIPEFRQILEGSAFNTFELKLEAGSSSSLEFIPLFPRGEICFLADSVIKQQPGDASRITTAMSYRIRKGGQGKLLGRPALLDWIAEVMGDELEEHLRSGERGPSRIYDELKNTFLCLNTMMEEWKPDPSATPRATLMLNLLGLDRKNLKTAPPEGCPVYYMPRQQYEPWEDHWRKAGKNDSVENIYRSDGLLLEWFAEWAALRADKYRRFVFVTGADEKHRTQWRKKYQHIFVLYHSTYSPEGKSQKQDTQASPQAKRPASGGTEVQSVEKSIR